MKAITGIDLGTSNVVVAEMSEEGPREIDLGGGFLMPSYVQCASPADPPIVGEDARQAWGTGESHCYRRFKLDMGTDREYAPGITPQRLTQWLLEEVKRRVLGDENTIRHWTEIEAVVSVPHGWDALDSPRRMATLAAGRDAGLQVNQLVSEPVAAAAYYTYLKGGKGRQTVLVCDMGGGTFDVSLVEVIDNVRINVIDAEKNDCAGMAADAYFLQYLLETYGDLLRLPVERPTVATLLAVEDPEVRRLLSIVEQAKRQLNARQQKLKPLADGPQGIAAVNVFLPGDRKVRLSYPQLANALKPVADEGRRTLQALLRRHPDRSPDLVVMAGGMGNMLVIQAMVAEVTGRPEAEIRNLGRMADRAIACGAALVANNRIQVYEVLKHSIGIVAKDAQSGRLRSYILAQRGSPVPFPERRYSSQIPDLPFFETVSPVQDRVVTEVVYGESPNPAECNASFQAEFPIPAGGPRRRLDFWVYVDVNGIVQVGVEGLGLDGVVFFQHEVLHTIGHYPHAVVAARSKG